VSSIGVYLDNGIEWIVVDLAAIAAGIRSVPLPWFFSDAQIRHAVETGGVDSIVTGSGLPAAIAACGPAHELYREARLQPVSSLSGAAAGATPGGKISFTSGSTGTPRGVSLEAAFIERSAGAIAAAIPHRAISDHLGMLPYSTLLENIAGIYVPLMLGKTVHAEPAARIGLMPDLGVDPPALQRVIRQVKPSSLILTPQLLQLVCGLAEQGAIDPGSLQFVAVGGARVGESLIRRARNAGVPAYEGYGLTEFASVATLNTPQADRVGTVGKTLPGVVLSLADDGEICLATELPGGGSVEVKTGDYGAVDADGFVMVRGRKSSLIVLSSGRNVSPEWIEAEFDTSRLIAQSCVLTESGNCLSALLLPAAPTITNREIDDEVERVNRELPPYARIAHWHRLAEPFSTHNQMLTANGRLRRERIARRLPALLAESRNQAPAATAGTTVQTLQEIQPC
jgi:long-subunit acyl-CoA synthetase (AMP-forming)